MTDALIIRPAASADGELLWRWRNAPDVRRTSLNTGEIPLADHLDWFRRTLADESREVFIAERRGQPIGMVRFDMEDKVATVSILLDADCRGQGLSKDVLSAAIMSSKGPWTRLRALVKPENPASRALFLSLGFNVVSEGETIVLEQLRSDLQ